MLFILSVFFLSFFACLSEDTQLLMMMISDCVVVSSVCFPILSVPLIAHSDKQDRRCFAQKKKKSRSFIDQSMMTLIVVDWLDVVVVVFRGHENLWIIMVNVH